MSTAELEIKKARLVRKILNEKDENIIVLMGENLHKIKHSAINAQNAQKREKLVYEFLQFVEINSINDLNFKFNREECYDRKVVL